MGVNLSNYRNKEELIRLQDPKMKEDINNGLFVGYPVNGVHYNYKQVGIWQENEADLAAIYGQKPGEVKVADLDGTGKADLHTGIGFFDHMLTAFSVHGGFGMKLTCRGALNVDCHHTIEDVGIALGKAFSEALGDKGGIMRYGSFFIPMDEALGFCAADISGRPFLVFEASFPEERIGAFDTCMCEEFFRAFAVNSGITLHLRVPDGSNSHHMTEALFKAFAHALKIAVQKNATGETLSTKGVL